MDVDARIEELAERRQRLWSDGTAEAGEVAGIDKELALLYEERRIARAKASDGRDRGQIIKAAKLDTELERLMAG